MSGRAFFLYRSIIVSFFFLFFLPIDSRSEEIMIFSPSMGDAEVLQVEEKTGKVEIVISSFSSINSITVNNKGFPGEKWLKRSIYINYSLDSGHNTFHIHVVTENAEQSKKITIRLKQNKPLTGKEEEKNWSLIVIPALETLDNAEDASWSSNRIQATKLSLILIPSYIEKIDDISHLLYQGLLLRENFFSDEEISTEAVFSQLTVGLENKVSWGNWKGYLGGGNVGTQSAGPYGLSGAEIEEEDNMFLGGNAKITLGNNSFLGMDLRLTFKKMKTVISPSHDETGRLSSFQINGAKTFSTIKATFKLGTEQNNVRGKYQDYKISNLILGGEVSLDPKRSIKLVISGRNMAFAEYDPFKQEKETTTLLISSLQGSYSIKNQFRQKLFLELKWKEQVSNVTLREFQTTSLSLSSLFIF